LNWSDALIRLLAEEFAEPDAWMSLIRQMCRLTMRLSDARMRW
jgi:hypothetical protein